MESIQTMPTERRRALQRDAGLTVLSPTLPPPRRGTMHEQTENRAHRGTSREQLILERLSSPPTFKEVVVHELKRAAIWAPVAFTTIIGAFWLQKKILL